MVADPVWTIEALKDHFDERIKALNDAVTKADAAYEKRMDSTNEWRQTLESLQNNYITKEQVRWTFMALIAGASVAIAIFIAIKGG